MDKSSLPRIILATTVLALISIVCVWLYHSNTNHKMYTIGLVWAPASTFHEQLERNFRLVLARDKNITLKSFAVSDITDAVTLNAVCQAALTADVDIILSIGWKCLKALASISSKRNYTKPIVFTGISEATALEVTASSENQHNNITGIYDAGVYAEVHPIDILLTVKPTVKAILLPYFAMHADNNQKYAEDAKEIAQQANVQVTLLPIDNIQNTLFCIENMINQHDALLYLEADLIAQYGIGISKLASQYGVTLFACTPDTQGKAAFTYYAEFIYIAEAAYTLIKNFIYNNKQFIPLVKLTSSRVLTINVERCEEQGIPSIDPLKVVQRIKSNPKLTPLYNRIIIENSKGT